MWNYTIRAFMVYDTHEIELPNHQAAMRNLDLTNHRLRIERVWVKAA